MSHIWVMSHNLSCYVMSQIWISHMFASYMSLINKACHIYESCHTISAAIMTHTHVCDTTHSCMRHKSFVCVKLHIYVCTMGWLRSVGSIKLQVSYAEYRLFHRALLQKRPLILSILLAKATPYESFFDETRLIHGYIYLFMCVSVCVCVCV